MLVAAIALLAGALAGWTVGRRPGRTDRRGAGPAWKVPGLLPAAALILIVGERVLGGGAGVAVMSAGYLGLIGFALVNGRRPGLALVAVGLLANLAVTAVDGGMPVRGQPPGRQIGDQHHGMSTSDRLAGFADVIRISPLGETVSPGDLLIAAGGGVAVFFWLEPAARRAGRRGKGGGAPGPGEGGDTPGPGEGDEPGLEPDRTRQPAGRA